MQNPKMRNSLLSKIRFPNKKKKSDEKLSMGVLPFVRFIEAIAALKHLPNHSTFQF